MGKGRGATLTSCDKALVAFVVLGAVCIFAVGLLDFYHVLPISHFKEKQCQVHGVTQILSQCLDCEDYQYYDGDARGEPDPGRHTEPREPDMGLDAEGGGRHGVDPNVDGGPEDGDRRGEAGGDGRLRGGHGEVEGRDGGENPDERRPPGDRTAGEVEGPDGRPDTEEDRDQRRPPGEDTGERDGRPEPPGEGGVEMTGRGDHGEMMDGDPAELFAAEYPNGKEPPIDGNPEDWFGKGGKGRHGKGKGGSNGECPPVAALLIHVNYDGMKAMLHGDHSSHDVPHSFADCGLDYNYDYHYPKEYPDYWEPYPMEPMTPTPARPPMNPDMPDKPADFPGEHIPAEIDMGPGGPTNPMPLKPQEPMDPMDPLDEGRHHEEPGKPPRETGPGMEEEEPLMGELGGRPEHMDENDPTKQHMSGEMHALMKEFQMLHDSATTFPCYVHHKTPEHVYYEAPFHHHRMGRYRNICYPVVVTVVLLLVLAIKKICDAKAGKRVSTNLMIPALRPGEKYIMPNGMVAVPMAPPQSKAADDEKNPTVLGPEVVPGGIRVGSRTVLMEGPVTTGEKEAEALGVTSPSPRSMVSDPFPPVEPGYERVESPPPAYNNLTPRY